MVTRNVDIASLTTFGIHAIAAAVARYADTAQLLALLSDNDLPRPIKAIGGGSNLLFVSDYPGTLLVGEASAPTFIDEEDSTIVSVPASMVLDDLCLTCCQRGLWGLENISGIPGCVGGATVQNAGAYGAETADRLVSVTAIDTHATPPRLVTLNRADMGFGYRHSILKVPDYAGRYIITEVTFRLSRCPEPHLGYADLAKRVPTDCPTPMDVRQAVLDMRNAKLPDPAKIGSAGSYFTNPVVPRQVYDRLVADSPSAVPCYPVDEDQVKIPAAWLIDHAGLKGLCIGGAAIWQTQPLVIVNATGNATADDILAIETEVKSRIYRLYGIHLRAEVEKVKTKLEAQEA